MARSQDLLTRVLCACSVAVREPLRLGSSRLALSTVRSLMEQSLGTRRRLLRFNDAGPFMIALKYFPYNPYEHISS